MGTPCFMDILSCPNDCPERIPENPDVKGCYVDCSIDCNAICRNRRANCSGVGAACYDPRFIGGDGIMFYFHGKSNQDFSLVSDDDLQINAHFIGRRPEGRTRDYTWVQSLGIMFGTHTFTVGANKVSKWDDGVDHFFFAFDKQPLTVPVGYRSLWKAPSGDLIVQRNEEHNGIVVLIPEMVEILVRVVPVTKEDDRVHNYQIPSDDCFAHLETEFKFFTLSSNVEGVLGQTYRPNFRNPVKVGVPMPIMGGENKYRTSSLLTADCKACIFMPNPSPVRETENSHQLIIKAAATSLDCTGKLGDGQGIFCRR
eukprot:PITA_21498